MTTSSMSTSITTERSTIETGDQGSTAEQAKSQARHAAGVAGDEAKSVAGDVRQQARGLLDETRNQVQDQSRTQRDRLVGSLRTFSDDLDQMAQQRSGLASDAAREVASRARSVSQQLDGREPTELLEDLRSFARRRPGLFLAGSLAAGVVVGRILRGTRDAAQGATSSDTTSDTSDTGSNDTSWDTGGDLGSDIGGVPGRGEYVTTQERPVVDYDPTLGPSAPAPAPMGDPLTDPLTPTETARPVGGP